MNDPIRVFWLVIGAVAPWFGQNNSCSACIFLLTLCSVTLHLLYRKGRRALPTGETTMPQVQIIAWRRIQYRQTMEFIAAMPKRQFKRFYKSMDEARTKAAAAAKKPYTPFVDDRPLPAHTMVAMEFARECVRRGAKVRFKSPDGLRGSQYVRVNDKTVRFADHAQPWGPKGTLGGYSPTLKRRHVAAKCSVDPETKLTVADAFEFVGL